MNNQVVLVDRLDNKIGTMPKLEAHQKGILHRAFSVFIFNSKGEALLQQRAFHKYHSAGLWTNTCCSHPMETESLLEAAQRRLDQEMGIKCKLVKAFDFIYKATLENGLIEHEFDHVFIGHTDQLPILNSDEVQSYKYCSVKDLEKDLKQNPKKYTSWFKICFNKVTGTFR